jgi:capsular polysaccharide transport system permease protein
MHLGASNGGSVLKRFMNNLVSQPRPVSRNALQITLAVWKALLLRESLARLFGRRAAWAWLLLEPLFHIGFMVLVFTVIRVRNVGGIETALWLVLGFMGFFMFRRSGTQGANAIGANRSLFAYRQVKPVDTVLVRCALEGLLMLCILLLVLTIAGLWGLPVWPHDPLAAIQYVLGLWCLGVGFALVVSVAQTLVDELGNVVDMAMMPMYLLSGVMFPLAAVPYPYREWLLLNPVAHGLEGLRLAFAPHYHAVPELSMAYLYAFALAVVFMGLALHVRYQNRLVAQ